MATSPGASILYYDEDTQQLKICTVPRSRVQAIIDNASPMTIPPDAPEHSTSAITDEDARQLGSMAILIQAMAHLELRQRLQITTAEPMDWSPIKPPTD